MDIRHIADLARIELTPEEEIKFGADLARILDFVKELEKINTEGIEPLAGGTLIENDLRSDAAVSEDLENEAATLLAAVPIKKKEWVKVKSTFE